MNQKFLLSVTLCISCCTAFAQQKFEWKEAVSGGYRYRYVSNDPMKARFYTLPNGLKVILSVNHKQPRIKTLIAVRAGSNNDPKDHTGLAHYLEHMLFKGTYRFGSLDSTREKGYLQQIEDLYDTYNNTTDPVQRKLIYKQIDSVSGIAATYAISNEYDKIMTNMGAQGTNAHTSVEETVYEEDIPANAVDKFLAVQAERFRNPVFRLFHTELEAVYEEKNRTLDNDGSKAYQAMLAALFPTHNYGQQTTIGTVEHLKNPSLKAIREFYNDYYVPGNMAIIMAGDFNPDEIIKKTDRAFAYMVPKEAKEYRGPVEQAIASPVTKNVFGPEAESVMVGFRLPGVKHHESTIIISVIDQLLSNGKAGLFDIHLNKMQKVLTAGAGLQLMKDYSVMMLTGKAKDGQSLEEVKDLLLSQLALLGKGDFDEKLIDAIVANFKLSELKSLESNDTRANMLMNGFVQHTGEMWNNDVAFVEQMKIVKKREVVEFVKKHLTNNYVAVFKRKGDDRNFEKVEKPPITPIVINRDAESDFVKFVASIPANKIQPLWVDYDKEISKSRVGDAEVLNVQNKDNDLFSLSYRFDIGSYNDKQLALAAGYLQYLGDNKYTAQQISREFYNIACSFAVSVGAENTTVTISGLQENLRKAVRLFENLIANCKPDENALRSLVDRILKSRADAKLSKSVIAKGLNNYAIYGARNPFNYQLSNAELSAITARQLTDELHRLFKYKHTIIYYGPQSSKNFIADIKKLHKVSGRFTTAPPAVKFEKIENIKSQVLFADCDMVQSEITWINNSMTFDSSNVPLVQLFNEYFGGDMGSVVFQTIRESKSLAYSTYAYYSQPDKKDARYTTFAYVGSQADKMKEAVAAMNELLNKLPESKKGLQIAKESILQNIASERIPRDEVIFRYLNSKRLGLTSDVRKYIYEKVPALTFDDIKSFHAERIAGKPHIYCVIASENKIKMNDLKKIGEVQKLTLEQIFGY